jgi:hypothetical protein
MVRKQNYQTFRLSQGNCEPQFKIKRKTCLWSPAEELGHWTKVVWWYRHWFSVKSGQWGVRGVHGPTSLMSLKNSTKWLSIRRVLKSTQWTLWVSMPHMSRSPAQRAFIGQMWDKIEFLVIFLMFHLLSLGYLRYVYKLISSEQNIFWLAVWE